jgi:hypothetical protein
MFRNKTGVALRELLESQGEDMAVEVVRNLLETKKVQPHDFSIREIWEACHPGTTNISEAIVSSAFPKLTGELINSRLIAAYEAIPTIGEQLVTTVPSNVQNETIAGMTATETLEEVGEGKEVPGSTFTEKYVTALNKKYERRIDITEETIMFDKSGQILARADTLGANARRYKERLILRGIQDADGDVYNPSGTPTTFYSTSNQNLITSNPFGESGLEGVIKQAQMMKGDSLGTSVDDDYIFIDTNNLQVLVPVDLWVEAWQMANSTLTPESSENAQNFFKGRFTPLSSPFITHQSTTTWYAGNFAKDFWWLEVWPIQTISLRPGSEMEYLREIKASHKVRMYGTITAVDHRHSFKCTA